MTTRGPGSAAASDAELMRRVQQDHVEAFEQLYDRHCIRAFRVAQAVCHDAGRAEDAVQEGFLSIWHSRMSYRAAAGSFQAWSMRIVQNRAIDTYRREVATQRPRLAEPPDEHPDPATPSVVDSVVADSEGDALRGALLRIAAAQAEVIALAYFGELSHSEIAEQLALPPGTVKGRIRLGLEKLRERMDASA